MDLAQEIRQNPQVQALIQRECDKIIAELNTPKPIRPAHEWRLPRINWYALWSAVGFGLYWISVTAMVASMALLLLGNLDGALITLFLTWPVVVAAAIVNEEVRWWHCL